MSAMVYDVDKLIEHLRVKFPCRQLDESETRWKATLKEGVCWTRKFQSDAVVSWASLEPTSNKAEDGPVRVMIQRNNGAKELLCRLSSDNFELNPDLDLDKGEEVTFSIQGKGIVHVSGYIIVESVRESVRDPRYTPGVLFRESHLFFENENKKHSEKGNDVSGSKKSTEPGLVKDLKKSGVDIENKDDLEDNAKADEWVTFLSDKDVDYKDTSY